MRESIYTFDGEIRVDVRELSRDVHCFKAILSEQDLESVDGLSGRAETCQRMGLGESLKRFIQGFRRTIPSSEKLARPLSI